jgi:putative RNA 2'-phosphotransferase
MNNKERIKLSKHVSYILRHNPSSINIQIDSDGWVPVDILIDALDVSLADLKEVVDRCNKQRFSFSDDFSYIRANQGHSIKVDVGLEQCKPPGILYHGTSKKAATLINNSGCIDKQNRLHVHLSSDINTANNVGNRYSDDVHIFKINSEQMYDDGYTFFKSVNGVWLTDHVPIRYFIV